MATTDCGRCVGLCCVALAFDRSESFGVDKPAGVPCPHLGGDDRCRIHDAREARGFSGCVRYECGGAGERAVAAVGRSWRDGERAATALIEAFRIEREVDEARGLLEAAGALPLPEADDAERRALEAELDASRWSIVGPKVGQFVRRLRRLPVLQRHGDERSRPRGRSG